MLNFRQITKELNELLDDIDEAFKLIAYADPVEEQELRKHIKEQQAKIRRLERNEAN